MKAILFGALLLISSTELAIQRPRLNYCTTDNKDAALRCPCLTYHPDLCETEDPLPNCCKATEKGTKATGGCHCCAKK